MNNSLKNLAASEKAARTATPQRQRTPGRNDEVKNNAGGFTFKVGDKERLERFLILGTDGGTFYVGEKKLTKQNADFVRSLIKRNERLVVDTIVDVSVNGRAAKNSPAIFALALVLTEGTDKAYAREAVNKVVRTGTHLFEFAQYLKDFGGMGRAKRKALAGWYTDKDANRLSYQAVKYRQRDGWTHRDVFRIAHPQGIDTRVGDFILGKNVEFEDGLIAGFQRMQRATSVNEVIAILDQFKELPWETIPTQFLTDARVWKNLFYNGAVGQTALIRNLTRFAKIGAFDDLVFVADVAQALSDIDRIVKGKVHPVQYANALGVYTKGGADTYGYGYRSSVNWPVNNKIAAAIEAGFENSFKAVTPANKRTMVSVDVSGSMTWGAPAGLVGLNYLEAAAVMAMVTVRTEPYAMVNAFSTNLKEVNVSDRDSFKTVVDKFRRISMGGTDVSQPMLHAHRNKLDIDTFAIYTDNETWAGTIKPSQALVKYRQASGNAARMAVIALASTGFTVADPTDAGQMDFVGFDSNAPKVLADFSAGRI